MATMLFGSLAMPLANDDAKQPEMIPCNTLRSLFGPVVLPGDEPLKPPWLERRKVEPTISHKLFSCCNGAKFCKKWMATTCTELMSRETLAELFASATCAQTSRPAKRLRDDFKSFFFHAEFPQAQSWMEMAQWLDHEHTKKRKEKKNCNAVTECHPGGCASPVSYMDLDSNPDLAQTTKTCQAILYIFAGFVTSMPVSSPRGRTLRRKMFSIFLGLCFAPC